MPPVRRSPLSAKRFFSSVLKGWEKVLLGPTSRLVVFSGDQDGDRLVKLDGVALLQRGARRGAPIHRLGRKIPNTGRRNRPFAVESDDSAGTRVVRGARGLWPSNGGSGSSRLGGFSTRAIAPL